MSGLAVGNVSNQRFDISNGGPELNVRRMLGKAPRKSGKAK